MIVLIQREVDRLSGQRFGSKTMFDGETSRSTTVKFFIGVGALTFILRIFYAGNLYQDDGLWFSAAEEMLRGKVLYRDLFFDKPPGLPLVYAGLFRIFGAHIITVRLFTICYSVAVSGILYLIGSRLYDKRTGRFAAVMFAVFSTTYISGDMQSLNTDFLMTPFYAAAAYMLLRSVAGLVAANSARPRSFRMAIAGGALTGMAFQINAKGIYDLIFLAVLLLAGFVWKTQGVRSGHYKTFHAINYIGSALKMCALTLAGFILASLPFFIYISATHSLSRYRLYVWDLSVSYAGYYPISRAGEIFLRYGTDYLLLNNTLLITLVVVAVITIHRARRYSRKPGLQPVNGYGDSAYDTFTSDAALLIWFAVSFMGVATGGRFFAHYYFQVLPSLCWIGARGLVVIHTGLRNRPLRVAVTSLLIAGFIYTLVRSHSETPGLAVDWVSGRPSVLNREARIIAAIVRDLPDPAGTVDNAGAEGLRGGGPRTRAADGSSDYLFIWGNLPEVYYWSGLIPASGYLAAPPLTGLAADLQYRKEEYRALLGPSVTAAARAELARELAQTKPKYVVDELGLRDPELSIEKYAELQEFMRGYEKYHHDSGSEIPIYIKRDLSKNR
ncbi:MAG: glycosyltransferase family 39 protein [Blastocatellia bacterium]